MGRRWVSRLGVMSVAVAVLSGCVGATSREDFDAEVRARGGGASSSFVDESMAVIAGAMAAPSADELQLLSINMSPADRLVAAQVRSPVQPDFVDTVVVSDGEVRAITPVQDADDLPLDEMVFRFGDLPFDRLDELTDEAIEAFAQPDGYVDGISVRIIGDSVEIEFDLSSARRTGSVTFDIDGNLVEVDS